MAFLLGRTGVEVIVLEQHQDFLRNFPGDTIHPSTLELMHELGLLESSYANPIRSRKWTREADAQAFWNADQARIGARMPVVTR